MTTIKTRINISLPKEVEKTLGFLAKRDDMPEATKAVDLIRLALEIEEDQVLDKIAGFRDVKSAKFISHKKAWV